MDIEFHYYMTYLIAVKGGFTTEEARTIAYSSQFVDDNDMQFHIDKDKATAFKNYISQTMNILKPTEELLQIYSVFHFIPGDPLSPQAQRCDGTMQWLNCTPDSENAQQLFEAAMRSENLYRIGIVTHAYADTWAHQNFTGTFNEFNSTKIKLDLTVGHAQATHDPDEPALIWKDTRLNNELVDNRLRFLEAAGRILIGYIGLKEPMLPPKKAQQKVKELKEALDRAIGRQDQWNEYGKERVARYTELALQPEFGGTPLLPYDEDDWFNEAINEDVRGLRDRKLKIFGLNLSRIDPWTDMYTWKDSSHYKETDWHQFQLEVIAHQKAALELFESTCFVNVDLDTILKPRII